MKMVRYLISEDGQDRTLFYLVIFAFVFGAVGILSFLFVITYIEMLIYPLKIFNLIAMTVVLISLVFFNKFIYNMWKFYYIYVLKRHRKVIEYENKTAKRRSK